MTEGKVLSKWYEEERHWTQYIPQQHCYGGNPPTCMTTMFPVHHHDDEDWMIEIEGLTTEGKEKTERHEVSQETYDLLAVGHTYRPLVEE